jgi:hypothetical protein
LFLIILHRLTQQCGWNVGWKGLIQHKIGVCAGDYISRDFSVRGGVVRAGLRICERRRNGAIGILRRPLIIRPKYSSGICGILCGRSYWNECIVVLVVISQTVLIGKPSSSHLRPTGDYCCHSQVGCISMPCFDPYIVVQDVAARRGISGVWRSAVIVVVDDVGSNAIEAASALAPHWHRTGLHLQRITILSQWSSITLLGSRSYTVGPQETRTLVQVCTSW